MLVIAAILAVALVMWRGSGAPDAAPPPAAGGAPGGPAADADASGRSYREDQASQPSTTLADDIDALLPEERLAYGRFVARFDPVAYRTDGEAQYRWLLAHDFPSPAEIAAAERMPLDELEARARHGDRKAAIFFADRVLADLEEGTTSPALRQRAHEATTMLWGGVARGGVFQVYALDRALAWRGDPPESRIALLHLGRERGDTRLGESTFIRLRAYEQAGVSLDVGGVLAGLEAHRASTTALADPQGVMAPRHPLPPPD